MLNVNNLNVTLKKDLRTVIKDFSLVLNDGDKAAVIGEEGDGKSTLLKIIGGDDVSGYAEFSGNVGFTGAAGFLRQEMSSTEKGLGVYEYCLSIDGFADLPPGEISAVSRALGLSSEIFYSEREVGSLSGGERVKLQLARLLVEKPALYLLDEPSNDIDLETLEWLEKFINESAVPVLFVSHDETLIENTANVIVHIEQFRRKTLSRITVARLPYREYMERRSDAFEYQTQQARREKSEYGAKMEKFRKIYQRVEHEQNIISRKDPSGARLLKKKMHSVMSMGRRFERESENMTQPPDSEDAIFLSFGEGVKMPNGKVVLDFSLDKLTVGDRTLSRDIRLRVTGGEKVCITGKNGAGKTTLLKIIAENLLARSDVKAAYMPQNYEELLDYGATPVEFLAPHSKKDDVTRAMTYLGSVRFTTDEMSNKINALSGGQKGKLFLLKMIIDGADALILDEPTRNFSPVSNPALREVLRGFGGAIVSVSHDRKFIAEVCDKVYVLDAGGLLVDEKTYIS